MSNQNHLFFFLLLATIFYGISTLPQRSRSSPQRTVVKNNKNNNKNNTGTVCNHDKMDQCMLELAMIGDPNWRFPEEMQGMNRRCRHVKSLEYCIKTYTDNCLHADARQTIQVLLYGISKTNKHYCSNQRRKASLINTGKCANTFLNDINAFMLDMVKALHAIRYYPDNKMKFPLVCCKYHQYKERIMDKFEKLCTQNQKDEYEYLLDGYATHTMNMICGDYDSESDKCSGIIQKIPEWKRPLEHKSFVLPFVDIINSLN